MQGMRYDHNRDQVTEGVSIVVYHVESKHATNKSNNTTRYQDVLSSQMLLERNSLIRWIL